LHGIFTKNELPVDLGFYFCGGSILSLGGERWRWGSLGIAHFCGILSTRPLILAEMSDSFCPSANRSLPHKFLPGLFPKIGGVIVGLSDWDSG